MAAPINREAIMAALFALLDGGFAWKTSGRVLRPWSAVTSFPALFVQNAKDEYLTGSSLTQHRPTGLPPQVYIDAEIWLYAIADPAAGTIPETELNNLIGVIEGTLQPPPAPSAQTLGGLVRHCWIDGVIEKDAGHLDGKGKAIIPVRMLVPGVSSSGVASP